MDCVLLLEDDDDLREVLHQAFLMSGVHVVQPFRQVQELVSLGRAALECGCAVLDVNLGPDVATGLDAYDWLRRAGYKGRVIFLTGHASSYPRLRQVSEHPGTFLVEKPTSIPSLLTLDRKSVV